MQQAFKLDMAKRAGRGGSGRVWVRSIEFAGQTSRRSKRVIFKWVNQVAGQSGHGLSRVEFTHIFQTIFYFFWLK